MLEFTLSQETARTAPLLPPVEGREENLLFHFVSVQGLVERSQSPCAAPASTPGRYYPRAPVGTHFLKERAISFSSGFSGPWDDSVRRPASSLSPTTHFASSQESTVRGRYSSPRTSGQSRLGPREFVEDASERTAFCTIHPYSLSLHHHRYVDCAVGAACTASGGVAHAAQPVSLAHAHNSTRLRDSVRQATSQVQRRSREVGGSPERTCLAQGDCCPPGKGCNRAGPSSRDEAGVLQPLLHRTQERWWPSANPGSASLEPGFAQAPVQDADAQAHDQMHSTPGLVCSDRPEGRLLSHFDPSATQTVSMVCVRGSGMAVQGPPLRALPVPPCVHEGCRRRPYPVTGSGRQDPQLPRRLAYPSPIQRAVERPQGLGAPAPQPVGASGQLGKEQALPRAENLFSRCGVRLGEYDGTPHGGTCPSSAELPEFYQRQECGTTETVSEAPGAYGIHSCSHAAWIASYETTSALATLPGPEVAFLWAGVPLEQVSRHTVVTTDASSTGWGAICNGQAASGLWTGPRLLWHINCLELWAVHLALRQFRPLLLGKHHPETIRLIWSRFGEAQVDLFASPESSHCQLYFSLTEGPLGTDALAHSWPRALRKYAFPPVSLLAQTLCKLREDEEQVLLVAPHWPTRTWFPELISLATAPPWRIPLRKDLQAFSVSEECLVFGPVYSHVVLRPRPGYVPKVPTTPFREQVVNLQALPSEEADPALALLCPVRALRIYVTRTRSVRSSEQLFVCHGGQKGKAVSKQRLAHWIVEAVALAYQSQGEPCPLGVRAHSTRSVASSHALAHGASLADICRAAGWATPNTFARFYNLRVEPVSSRVLGK